MIVADLNHFRCSFILQELMSLKINRSTRYSCTKSPIWLTKTLNDWYWIEYLSQCLSKQTLKKPLLDQTETALNCLLGSISLLKLRTNHKIGHFGRFSESTTIRKTPILFSCPFLKVRKIQFKLSSKCSVLTLRLFYCPRHYARCKILSWY